MNGQNGSMARTKGKGNALYLVIGWLAAIVSLVRYTFVFGIVAIVLGVMVSKNGSRAGIALVVASVILMAAGLIFGDVLFNYLKHALGI